MSVLEAAEGTLPKFHGRLLVVLDKIGFPGGVVHGVGTYLLQTLPALADVGVTPRVVVFGPEHQTAEDLRQRGIEVISLNRKKWSLRGFYDIKRLIANWKPDLIHLHGIKSVAGIPYWRSRNGPPIVAHVHDNVESPIDPLLAYSLERAAVVLTPSPALKKTLEKRFSRLPNIVPMPCGYDLTPYANGDREGTRESLGFASEDVVLGCSGRLAAVKGQQDLIEALALLKESGSPCFPNLRAALIGDGPNRAHLVELAGKRGLTECVRFLGHRQDMPDVLAACDLIVVPSLWLEAFGLVALEAMASKKYVIASDTGGLADLVRDVGTLYPRGDIAALAEAIEAYLRAPAAYQGQIQKGLEAAQDYRLEAHTERLLEVYSRVLAEHDG